MGPQELLAQRFVVICVEETLGELARRKLEGYKSDLPTILSKGYRWKIQSFIFIICMLFWGAPLVKYHNKV